MRKITIILSFLWCVYGCWQGPQQVTEVNRLPELFPDFQGVTIPVNIAPLNFKVVGSDKLEVEFRKGRKTLLKCHGWGKIDIPQKKWHALLEDCKGDSLEVKVFACKDGQWTGYRPFPLWVAADSIDPYVAYLVNKKNRIRSIEKTLSFGLLYHFTHILDSRTHRTQNIKRTFELFGHNHGQRSLANSRRSPQNKGRNHTRFDHLAQHLSLSDQMLLSYIVIQRLGSQSFC